MAYHEQLPIYKAAYDFALYMYGVVDGFSRQHKYGIGGEVLALARSAARRVVRANALADKTPVLEDLRADLEELKLLLRLCRDLKAYRNFNSFETAFNRLIDICKQNEGWLKSQKRPARPGPEPPADASGYAGGRADLDHRAAPPPMRDAVQGPVPARDRGPVGRG